MNHTETFQKLVSLLGRSENDPEVIEILTELGVKFPLKRPNRSEDGYLIEKSEINFNRKKRNKLLPWCNLCP